VMGMVQDGRIHHALVVAALFHFHLKGHGAPRNHSA
jgi:hypothetical protein